MKEKLLEVKASALEKIAKANDLKEIEVLRIEFLGKKSEMAELMKGMGRLSAEERPLFGAVANEVRGEIEKELLDKKEEFEEVAIKANMEKEKIDVTIPGNRRAMGRIHPLNRVLNQICDIFVSMGFEIADGPEIETDYYNFEAMNMPKNHPARDMQDTYYISGEILLRTHTSPTQNRVMEKMRPKLPVKVIVPGKVYRRDDDATHSPMFHQVEGLLIDEGIRFSDLKGVLLAFVKRFFGENQEIRLRPSYFPFTEPSAEVDCLCVMCGGKGCRTCKGTGWMEILGSGMVHPNVLRMGGYDPENVTGFAFGMGVDRLAMLKYGVDDLRLFFENDLRFLKQF